MKKHFVTFFCPGTFVAEQDTQEIDSWDVPEAQSRAKSVKQRYNATPYGFQFSTRSRGSSDLDSEVTERSPMYYINCKVETLEEIKERGDRKDRTLILNMESNDWDRVATTIEGWKWTQPLKQGDVVLT